MLNWNVIDIIYIYDGTFEGLLTIVFDCYISKTIPIKIIEKDLYIPNILDKTTYINTDYIKSERIFNGISKNISYETLYNSYNAFLSNEKNKELYILKYLYSGFEIGSKINTMLSIDYILKVIFIAKKTTSECHRFKGILRFIQIDNDLFYSSIHPTTNILEPLGQHFIKRFPSQNFIINDQNRNLAFLYDTHYYKIIENLNLSINKLYKNENVYQNLWRTFFNTISIKERENLKLQMQFMPKKYWKDLIEKTKE